MILLQLHLFLLIIWLKRMKFYFQWNWTTLIYWFVNSTCNITILLINTKKLMAGGMVLHFHFLQQNGTPAKPVAFQLPGLWPQLVCNPIMFWTDCSNHDFISFDQDNYVLKGGSGEQLKHNQNAFLCSISNSMSVTISNSKYLNY